MKVAVVIPCYNVAEHLPHALASVEAQTHRDLEVVCVDDGSTDGTMAVIGKAQQQSDLPFTTLVQENSGACVARNKGVEHTTGEYVQFLDADDVLDPDKIAAQLELAGTMAAPDLVVGDYETMHPNGQLIARYALHGSDWMGLIKTRLGTTSANLFKRDALEKAGHWSDRMASSQDYELMFRILRNGGKVAWDQKIRTHVLKRAEGSISRTHMKDNWERYIALRKDMRAHLHTSDPVRYKEEIAALDQYIFMAIRVLSTFDLDQAIKEYDRSIPKGFRPQVSPAITEKYVAMHRVLGYAWTEKLLRRYKPEPTQL